MSYKYLDFVGMVAAFACGLHCMLWPILLTSLLAGSTYWVNGGLLELGFIAISAGIAITALSSGYLRGHGRLAPLLLATAGFGLIWLSKQHLGENPLHLLLGGLFIAGAHFLNYRWRSCLHNSNRTLQKKKKIILAIIIAGIGWGLYDLNTARNNYPIQLSQEELLELIWTSH